MPQPNVIGLVGYKRSGKDTVANWLHDHWGYTRVSFASPIKSMICKMLNEDGAALERHKDETVEWLGVTRRYMLQTLGTDWGRVLINPDVWILAAMEKIRRNRFTVITDVRFENEAAAIARLPNASENWYISRASCSSTEHASEQEIEIIKYDWVIHNHGTQEDLYNQLQSVTNMWHEKDDRARRS